MGWRYSPRSPYHVAGCVGGKRGARAVAPAPGSRALSAPDVLTGAPKGRGVGPFTLLCAVATAWVLGCRGSRPLPACARASAGGGGIPSPHTRIRQLGRSARMSPTPIKGSASGSCVPCVMPCRCSLLNRRRCLWPSGAVACSVTPVHARRDPCCGFVPSLAIHTGLLPRHDALAPISARCYVLALGLWI